MKTFVKVFFIIMMIWIGYKVSCTQFNYQFTDINNAFVVFQLNVIIAVLLLKKEK